MKAKQLFINWAELWHGDHKHIDCPVSDALEDYENGAITFTELVEIVAETDGDWADSFFALLDERAIIK